MPSGGFPYTFPIIWWGGDYAEPYRVEVRDSSGNLVAMLKNAFDVSTMGSVNELGAAGMSLPVDDTEAEHLVYGNQLWVYKNGTLEGKYLIRQIEKARV